MSEMTRLVNTTGGLVNVTSLELIRGQGWGDSVNILGLVISLLQYSVMYSFIIYLRHNYLLLQRLCEVFGVNYF